MKKTVFMGALLVFFLIFADTGRPETPELDRLANQGSEAFKSANYQEAVTLWEKGLKLAGELKDKKATGFFLMNIGEAFRQLSQYEKALSYLENARIIYKEVKNRDGEGWCLSSISMVYAGLGRYEKALSSGKEALSIHKETGNRTGEAADLYAMGEAYRQLGQYEKALSNMEQARAAYKEIKNRSGEAWCLSNISMLYLNLGQYEKMIFTAKESLSIHGEMEDQAGIAADLFAIGEACRLLGRYDIAPDCFSNSLAIFKEIGNRKGEVDNLNALALVYFSLGQYNKALQPLRQVVQISEQIGALEATWRGYRGLGKSLWKSGNPEEAVSPYEKATATIEILYQHTAGLKEEERSSMIGEKNFVYQEFIDLLLELHRKSPDKGYDKQAFTIAEKGKSRTFQELMAKAGAKIALSGDEAFKKMVEKEQQIIGEITNLQGLLFKEMSKPEKQRSEDAVKSFKEQLAKTEKTLIDLEKEIDTQYPRYADLKRPQPLSVEDLQDVLKPGETVIAYAVGKEKVAAFVIDKERFKMVELGINTKELADLISSLRKGLDPEAIKLTKKLHGLDATFALEDLEKFDPKIAYTLYQQLVAPLVSDLKGITKLYIAADDILYTLPFEALVDQEMDKEKFREARQQGKKGGKPYLGEYATLHYLVDTYTITYLPSASMLRSLRKYEKPGYGKWNKPLIAFADPIFSEQEEKSGTTKSLESKGANAETQLMVELLTRSTGTAGLGMLKESSEEAEAIAKEVKGKPEDMYLREKATEENIYKTKLQEARYLLFSTHGLLGGDFSGVAEPALALTLVDNPAGRDGFLIMSEVLGLDLNAELIILSACNTSGKGDKAGSGEGFVGLTRSFMYAGTRVILVTHWSVESQAAKELMVESFKAMQKETRPEALRQAKLKMKSSTRDDRNALGAKLSLSHPFFWAPFVIVGEGE